MALTPTGQPSGHTSEEAKMTGFTPPRGSEKPLPAQMRASTPLILLADDEAHITCVVAQKLRSVGYVVVTAQDGEEAFETAKSLLPAIVITDLQMPRMSGLDLAIKLRETPETASTPVIMLTARGYIIEPSEAARTNIREIMGKPFSVREVVRKVTELLELMGHDPVTAPSSSATKSPRSSGPAEAGPAKRAEAA